MENKFENVRKEVLVEIVKLAQIRGMKGSQGGWKDFLSVYDKQLGLSLCDPARRSRDALIAFLETFSNEDDLKFFDKVMETHNHRDTMEALQKKGKDMSPEEKLVYSTIGHPQFALHYTFPSHEEGWLVIKQSKKSKARRSNAMVAVDCEMVLCKDGTDALVRVCVVDRELKVKLDEFVKPNKAVADYRTDITGVTAKDLEGVNCSLEDVQESMKKLLSKGTILVGHGLNNDLQALKVDHRRVIDTSLVFKYWSGSNYRRPSLNNLCKSILGYELRKVGAPHNCVEDARAAMKLVLANIEGGVDSLPLVHNDVPETDMMRLLVHRIPIGIPVEKLHEIIPGDFTIELKANKKAGGDKYSSAFAVFKNQEESNRAFDDLDGIQETDSSGRSQKFICFQLDTGIAGDLYVRKMVSDGDLKSVKSKKRSSEDEIPVQPKKLKTGQTEGELQETGELKETVGCNRCDDLSKEIELLKKELRERDNIIVALTRKQLGI